MNKRKKNFLNYLIIFLFVFYMFLFISSKNGYITNEKRNRMYLTNEQIEKFEKDVDEGKNIDLEKYIENKKDYSNSFSKLGYNVSNGIVYIVNNSLKGISSFILRFFT